jgi:hypothetical protein
MSELFTISFTTKTLVNKYDKRGKLTEKYELANPIKITALPRATAMSYATCDNFVISPYVSEHYNAKRSIGDRKWAGTAAHSAPKQRNMPTPKPAAKKTVAPSTISNAAASGDLSAAINN